MQHCSHGTPFTLEDILAAQPPRTAMLPPIESPNPFALLELDDNTSLPDHTTTGVTTGKLNDSIGAKRTADDLIGAKTTADNENLGASSFNLL